MVFLNTTFHTCYSTTTLKMFSTTLLSLDVFPDGSAIQIQSTSVWNLLLMFMMINLSMLIAYSFYCEFDPYSTEFSLKLLSFFYMVWQLLLCNGMFTSLFCWEFIGLISFRLIAHWTDRTSTTRASVLAVTFNRWGDLFLNLTVAKFLIVSDTGATNMGLALILMTCAIFKSVSALTFLWLPEAMEGPTPVSSLLHSCTLVMAGLFMMMRQNIASVSTVLVIMSIVALVMVVMTVPTCDNDAKRVVAASTVLMTTFLWQLFELGSVHAVSGIAIIHAGYKSCLFVWMGKNISENVNSDLSNKSGVMHFSPYLLALWIATAPKFTVYELTKHVATATENSVIFSSLETLVVLSLMFLWWICKLKFYVSGVKYTAAPNGTALFQVLPALTCVGLIAFMIPVMEGQETVYTSALSGLLAYVFFAHCKTIFSPLSYGTVLLPGDVDSSFIFTHVAIHGMLTAMSFISTSTLMHLSFGLQGYCLLLLYFC